PRQAVPFSRSCCSLPYPRPTAMSKLHIEAAGKRKTDRRSRVQTDPIIPQSPFNSKLRPPPSRPPKIFKTGMFRLSFLASDKVQSETQRILSHHSVRLRLLTMAVKWILL
ncbi:MAG TPA: hypothetical protein V6D23_25810, partial [Candidatus Obscuribacterales bacterium]